MATYRKKGMNLLYSTTTHYEGQQKTRKLLPSVVVTSCVLRKESFDKLRMVSEVKPFSAGQLSLKSLLDDAGKVPIAYCP